MRFLTPFAASVLFLIVAATSVSAQAPDSVSFQGKLTDTNGNPINQNGLSMTFRMYKNLSIIWTETQSVNVIDGVFNVYLGKVTALDTVAFDQPITLGIKVQGQATEMSPRTPLTAAAYAKALPGFYTSYREDVDGPSKSYNVVGGASNNVVGAEVVGATIGGGGGLIFGDPGPNIVLADFGTVGGGGSNTASGGFASTVAGGFLNTASQTRATVAGGYFNVASGNYATIGGGSNNMANGFQAAVGGGVLNTASGNWATVPGGIRNSAKGEASFAAGYNAKALHKGSFVWNDRSQTATDLSDSLFTRSNNQFLIRASGGVGINTTFTSNNSLTVHGGAMIDTLRFAGGGGSYIKDSGSNILVSTITLSPRVDDGSRLGHSGNRWEAVWSVDGTINTSDARAKTDVYNLSYGLAEVLDLRPVSFRWKKRPESGLRLGLIAQEVAKIVPELIRGEGDAMLGMNYGELVPILIKSIQEQQGLIEAQRMEIDDLRTAHSDQDERLAALEARLRP